MKRFITMAFILTASCGNSDTGKEIVGQPLAVSKVTPIICSDYTELMLSLGTMRNGIGSVSKEDVRMYVPNPQHEALLKEALAEGRLVRVTSNKRRWTWCVPLEEVIDVSIVDSPFTEKDL